MPQTDVIEAISGNMHIDAEKQWTIMVYMAGDNNLSIEMAYALEELKAVTQNNKNIDLYVYYDGQSSDVPTLYCDFSSPAALFDQKRTVNFYQSHKINNKLIDVNDEFNENSAAVDNIINFINWCVRHDTEQQKNEKKYAFIFSGHSFGFINWGLFKDEKSDYYMTHPKLKYLFERVTWDQEKLLKKARKDERRYRKRYRRPWSDKHRTERTTVVLGRPLDLLGFDSCVMSTLELASQFKDFARTMVASEGSIPTAGWNYAQILNGRISENPRATVNEIAISFVEQFIKQQNKFAIADISVDISAWDLTKLDELEKKFGRMVDTLLDCLADDSSVLYKQVKRLLVYVHWTCQTYMFEQHIDLGDFCRLLCDEIDLLLAEVTADRLAGLNRLRRSCQTVVDEINKCILITGFSGSDFQFSTGISLFFPWSLASYYSASKDYERLSFICGKYSAGTKAAAKRGPGQKWNEFLQKFLGEVTFREAQPLTRFSDGSPNIRSAIIYESYADMNDEAAGAIDHDSKQPPNTGKQPPNTGKQPPNTGKQPPNTGKQPPNTGKQPPNTGKQPPNTGRQPPNTGRMLTDMNIFFSRFMRLKNFESNWNRAGFRSERVIFRPVPDNGSSSAGTIAGRGVIEIPEPRGVEKRLNEFWAWLHQFADGNNLQLDAYIDNLKNIVQNADEPTINELLDGISELKTIVAEKGDPKDLQTNWKNYFSASTKFISDVGIKTEILQSLDTIDSRDYRE